MMKFEPIDWICCRHVLARAGAERGDGDDRGDADEDAEHRERRAQRGCARSRGARGGCRRGARACLTPPAARRSDRASPRATRAGSRRRCRWPRSSPTASDERRRRSGACGQSSARPSPMRRGRRRATIPRSAADHREHDGLDEELHEDVALARADRHADADLARPLGDAHEHDVHDADAADEQADRGDADQQDRERRRGSPPVVSASSACVLDVEVVGCPRPRCGGAGAGCPSICALARVDRLGATSR